MNIEVPRLERFAVATLRQAGFSEPDAAVAAAVLVLADAWGVTTHGSKNLRTYLRRVRAGGIRHDGRPRITAEGPAWAFVDGDQALGMIAASFAMRTAIAKARIAGMAYVTVGNTCHFGAAGCYSVIAALEGQLGWAMSNDTPTVTAPGARGAVLGSNPFSFAAPIAGADPLVLDIATSTVAGGKVFRAAARGESIPPHWVVDARGHPTTDPTVWPGAGTLTPMAGHKGYGLALMIEILSAAVPGGPLAAQVLSFAFADPALPTGHSAAFLALDPTGMPGGPALPARLARLANDLRALPRADDSEGLRIPGEIEWENRRRSLAQGLDLPADVAEVLRELSAETGVPLDPPLAG